MNAKNVHLQLLSKEELLNIMNPFLTRLDSIEKKLNAKNSSSFKIGYYRNKELKEKFGLSPNTIIKYREAGIIPFTMIGEVYLYPIKKMDEILEKNSNWDLFENKAS
ncbi:helix-turn-helix domain-containing protein [Winogradskyella poriferorum]|uniref:helix-turn-helix domain-containing protein n=1 Tax=Winogradskyella poriferorum TaxID=307627 RepID=UPI003D64DBE8